MEKEIPNASEHDNTTTSVPRADVGGIGETEVEVQSNVDVEETAMGEKRTGMRLFAILAALFLSLFVAALDATIVATAVPTIAAQLHSATGYTWIGGAYLLGNAASGPVWYTYDVLWFTCGLTPSIDLGPLLRYLGQETNSPGGCGHLLLILHRLRPRR
jgi:hypothetical protein